MAGVHEVDPGGVGGGGRESREKPRRTGFSLVGGRGSRSRRQDEPAETLLVRAARCIPSPAAAAAPGRGPGPLAVCSNYPAVSISRVETTKGTETGGFLESDVGIDNLQLTAAEGTEHLIYNACMEAAGGVEPDVGKPRRVPGKGKPFERGRYWSSGVELHSGGRRPWLIVPGSACSLLGFSGMLALGRACMSGASVTRIDVRRDLHGENLSLVRDIERACDSLQLRRLLQYTPYPIRSSCGVVLGRGVVLGSYKSPKFIRCYDKGLESDTLPEGHWIRFEAQFRKSFAHKAACMIFAAGSDALAGRAALSCLHGVVDFRLGDRDIDLKRAVRPAWWAEFVGSVEGVRISAPVLPPDVDRWKSSMQIQYLAVLSAAAERAGITLDRAVQWISEDLAISPSTQDNPMVGLLAAELRRSVDECSYPV